MDSALESMSASEGKNASTGESISECCSISAKALSKVEHPWLQLLRLLPKQMACVAACNDVCCLLTVSLSREQLLNNLKQSLHSFASIETFLVTEHYLPNVCLCPAPGMEDFMRVLQRA